MQFPKKQKQLVIKTIYVNSLMEESSFVVNS